MHKNLPIWNTQDAKAKFSQLVHSAEIRDQLITHRNEPIAVIMSKKRYDKLTRKNDSLLAFFKKSPLPELDLNIERIKDFPREIDL